MFFVTCLHLHLHGRDEWREEDGVYFVASICEGWATIFSILMTFRVGTKQTIALSEQINRYLVGEGRGILFSSIFHRIHADRDVRAYIGRLLSAVQLARRLNDRLKLLPPRPPFRSQEGGNAGWGWIAPCKRPSWIIFDHFLESNKFKFRFQGLFATTPTMGDDFLLPFGIPINATTVNRPSLSLSLTLCVIIQARSKLFPLYSSEYERLAYLLWGERRKRKRKKKREYD